MKGGEDLNIQVAEGLITFGDGREVPYLLAKAVYEELALISNRREMLVLRELLCKAEDLNYKLPDGVVTYLVQDQRHLVNLCGKMPSDVAALIRLIVRFDGVNITLLDLIAFGKAEAERNAEIKGKAGKTTPDFVEEKLETDQPFTLSPFDSPEESGAEKNSI